MRNEWKRKKEMLRKKGKKIYRRDVIKAGT